MPQRHAPTGGATICSAPFSVWLRPATRARCRSGTIREVEACIAAQWKTPPTERMNSTAKTCPTRMAPIAARTASTTVVRAMRLSVTIITSRRFQRSTSAPTKGPRKTWGSKATIVASASTVAEPVVFVNHQTRANCTSMLPNREKAWPVQMVKNRAAQWEGRKFCRSIRHLKPVWIPAAPPGARPDRRGPG